MKISVIGSGYVGLVAGACFADMGNDVICQDIDQGKIKTLNEGKIPIYEPGLEELIKKNVKAKRLLFTSDFARAVEHADIIFIAVGTPPRDDGGADLSYVENVARGIAAKAKKPKIVVEKSTVPVLTGERVYQVLHCSNGNAEKGKCIQHMVASNPEFLREGTAVSDFMKPDRVVIGSDSEKAKQTLKELYAPLKAKVVLTDIKSAEIIKHASNSFLAMKISFINAVANVCEKTGANVEQVAEGMGLDKRIGPSFLNAGIGYGGFCFPKDVDAFIWIAERNGYDFALLKEVQSINRGQRKIFVKKVEDSLWVLKGKTIGVLGLAFKPNTDDMRFAPSIEIINELQAQGAKVKAFDPEAMGRAKEILKGVEYCNGMYEAAKGADALLFLTEWDEFKKIDLGKVKKLMKQLIICDGRNMFNPGELRELGFNYVSIGRL
ncbi:MAG: UDP-glucose/GDP-mannose dehydrogenase family protein [Candidatus Diapherotrites archaeon]|uniref:UDP-glucose 6-dehydrogenase n=1 Tax=Candidatus Iainarchaeum sp. TaxID=3101447 RepID=A0A938YVP9_9ARCH|nr:UDP-glucose/GDP-mannose dehydrogenase family protein [Candidatus Diapherotrites archaeon]